MNIASRVFGRVRKRSALLLSTLLLVLAQPALAQQQVEKISDIQWTPGTYVYQKGDWIPSGTLRVINTFLAEQEMPITLVIADTVKDEVFRNPDGEMLTGYLAADYACGTHGIMKQSAFRAQVDEDTGLPNGSVLLVCPERVEQLGGNRPWQFYSSAYLDDLGLSWKQAWKGDLERVGYPYLKDGEIDQAVIRSVEAYHNKVDAHFRAVAFWKGFLRVLPWALAAIFLLVVAIVLLIKNRAAAEAKAKAQRELGVWLDALAGKGTLLRELNARKTVIFGAKRSDLEVEGEDLELANGVIDKIGRARLLLNIATNTVDRVQRLLDRPFVGFSSAPYEEALLMLEQPLEFDPKENVKAALTGNQLEEAEYLWAPISSFRPFSTSFPVMIDTFNAITKEASSAIDRFRANRSEVLNKLTGMTSELKDLEGAITDVASHMTEEELAALAVVTDEVIPGLREEIKQLVGRAVKSPTSHLHHVRDLSARVAEGEACAAALLDLLGNRPARRERYQALEEKGLKVDWLRSYGANCVGALITVIDSLDSDTPDLSGQAVAAAQAFPALVARVEALNKRRTLEVAEHERLKLRLRTYRDKLSAELGIPAEQLFTESGDDGDHRVPDEALGDATRELNQARVFLSQGKLDEAERMLGLADASNADAEGDIDMSLAALETYEQRREGIENRSAELVPEIDRARALLEELGEFDQTALDFRAGDPTHPRSNGTVADNLEEIDLAQQQRVGALENAARSFERGALLAAGDSLTDAENWNQFVANRIDEVQHKYDTLMEVDGNNAERLPKLLAGLEHQLGTPFEHHVRTVTMQSLTAAYEALEEANRHHGGELRNPFEIAEAVAYASDISSRFALEVQRDLEEYREAVDSAQRTRLQLRTLSGLLDSMAGDRDNLPDARAFEEAASEIDSLASRLEGHQEELTVPHSDWFVLDDRIDAIYNRASDLLLALRSEKKEGEDALAALSRARSKVRDARGWSGTYVSSVSGSFGKSALRRATDAFERGDFAEAKRQAEEAGRQAASAISSAEDDDRAERRRRKRQQEEEERRRRQRMSSTYSSSYSSSSSRSTFSSGGFGGFSSGGGGGGFGGGFSSGGGGSGW